ncbi:MAG: type II toxin-antitoxin system RelE/ParE family toxin [Candidatus Aminicenantes bacterium]|nr:type II toxin-antitoxin system RelE/ParE family toxin [Candidatus Aminicenantes bacterium]
MWKIKVHHLVVHEDFKKINKKDQSIILKTIYKKLGTSPQEYGSPLRHELKGYWKLKISDYRAVYKIEKEKIRVLVLKAGMRRDEEIYKEMLKRLKKL